LLLEGVDFKAVSRRYASKNKNLYLDFQLLHYKGKLSKFFFFGLLLALAAFKVGTPGGTTNIQTIFDVCPRILKHAVCYHSYSIPFSGLQLLEIFVLNLAGEFLDITPQKRTQ
jgi:hypothetical protein